MSDDLKRKAHEALRAFANSPGLEVNGVSQERYEKAKAAIDALAASGGLPSSAREKVGEALGWLTSMRPIDGWRAKSIALLESALAEPEQMPTREEMAERLAVIYYRTCGFVITWAESSESDRRGWLAVADAAIAQREERG